MSAFWKPVLRKQKVRDRILQGKVCTFIYHKIYVTKDMNLDYIKNTPFNNKRENNLILK